jgi:hypothetical protein
VSGVIDPSTPRLASVTPASPSAGRKRVERTPRGELVEKISENVVAVGVGDVGVLLLPQAGTATASAPSRTG